MADGLGNISVRRTEGRHQTIKKWIGPEWAELCPYNEMSIHKWIVFVHLYLQTSYRVHCPCPEQGRNLNSQLSSAISASVLPIEPQGHHQTIHRNPVNGLVMIFRFCLENWICSGSVFLFGKLEQILHLKVDCSDFSPVRDRGSLP